jgi:hypothetical protein
MQTSFFTAAGGGVRGKVVGIAHITIIQGGAIIEMCRLFTGGFLRVGGMIIGSIAGEGSTGIREKYLTNRLKGTGEARKKRGAGAGKILAESKAQSPGRNHSILLGMCSCNSPGLNIKR